MSLSLKKSIEDGCQLVGIKDAELARRMGVTRQYILNIKNQDWARKQTIENLADALGMDVMDFLRVGYSE